MAKSTVEVMIKALGVDEATARVEALTAAFKRCGDAWDEAREKAEAATEAMNKFRIAVQQHSK